MKVLVSIYSWESPRLYETELELKTGSKVIVPTEYGNELGKVELLGLETKEETAEKILRVATARDKEAFLENNRDKKEYLKTCRSLAKEQGLELKLIDARASLDNRQITFAFTADGRVDFRQLVKDLSRDFKKTIRMQQIGSRDEARKLGGYGICGRELCCVNFSGGLKSITTEMARVQQISHRGTERISGLCGRLMCCLAYEEQQYREMLKGMPEMYSVVNTGEGRGTVMDVNPVSQEIKVKLENGKYTLVKKEDLK